VGPAFSACDLDRKMVRKLSRSLVIGKFARSVLIGRPCVYASSVESVPSGAKSLKREVGHSRKGPVIPNSRCRLRGNLQFGVPRVISVLPVVYQVRASPRTCLGYCLGCQSQVRQESLIDYRRKSEDCLGTWALTRVAREFPREHVSKHPATG